MSATAFQRRRREMAAKLAKKEVKTDDLESLKEKAKELGIKGYQNMKKETLEERIKEKK